MINTCDYCDKEIENGKDYCSAECRKRAYVFTKYYTRWKTLFTVLLVVSAAAVAVGALMTTALNRLYPSFIIMGCGMILFGLTMLVFPFASQNTFSRFGIRRALLVTRILGIIIAVLGIVCIVLWTWFA